MSKNIF